MTNNNNNNQKPSIIGMVWDVMTSPFGIFAIVLDLIVELIIRLI